MAWRWLGRGGGSSPRALWHSSLLTESTMGWFIAEPSTGLGLYAESDGVWIRSKSGKAEVGQFRTNTPLTRLGRLIPTFVPQALESGLASSEGGAIRISHKDFAQFETQYGIDALDGVVPRAP